MLPERVSQILTVPEFVSLCGVKWRRISLTIFRACDHPFAFAVECDTSDVTSVALECQHSCRVGRLDVVQLDGVVACGGEEAFIRRDA